LVGSDDDDYYYYYYYYHQVKRKTLEPVWGEIFILDYDRAIKHALVEVRKVVVVVVAVVVVVIMMI